MEFVIGNTYDIAPKYTHELGGLKKDLTLVGIVTDHKLLIKMGLDIYSKYSRIKQMDATLTTIDEMTFLIFKKLDDYSQVVYTTIAKEWIDVYEQSSN